MTRFHATQLKGADINLNAAGLTPTVGHDLQCQRQQVIKGGIQHHGLDLWVGHHCPAGCDRKRSHRGIQVNEKLCGLTLDECVVHSTITPLIRGGWGAICPWKKGGSGTLCRFIPAKNWTFERCVTSTWPWATCEASYGPGVHNDVAELEAQLMYSELDHDIHGIGLVLRERLSLVEQRRRKLLIIPLWGKFRNQVKQDANVIQVSWITSLIFMCLQLIVSSTLLLYTKVTRFRKVFCEVTKVTQASSPEFRFYFTLKLYGSPSSHQRMSKETKTEHFKLNMLFCGEVHWLLGNKFKQPLNWLILGST